MFVLIGEIIISSSHVVHCWREGGLKRTGIKLDDGNVIYVEKTLEEVNELLNEEPKVEPESGPGPRFVTFVDINDAEMGIIPSRITSVMWDEEEGGIQLEDEDNLYYVKGPKSRIGEVIDKLNGIKKKEPEKPTGRTLEV